MTLAPLTPEDCDLRGYEWMPLFGGRLFTSTFEAHACDLAFRVAIKLYWECWQQVPAASLPNDDVQLCRLAGLGRDLKTWRKLRADGVLHGFRLCSDDRLYHGMLAVEALKAWESRQQSQHERDGSKERMRRWRARHANGDDKPVTRNVTRNNGHGDAQRDGQVTGDVTSRATDRTVQEKKDPPLSPPQSRGGPRGAPKPHRNGFVELERRLEAAETARMRTVDSTAEEVVQLHDYLDRMKGNACG